MKVQITQTDIDTGVTYTPTACPIALATNRAVRALGFRGYAVATTTLGAHGWCVNWFRSWLPVQLVTNADERAKLRVFALRFDDGDKVEPIDFEIDDAAIEILREGIVS